MERQNDRKQLLSTVEELIDFVLRAKRGEVRIQDAEIGSALMEVHSEKARCWQRVAEQLSAKYDKPLDEVKRDMIERKPELAQFLL